MLQIVENLRLLNVIRFSKIGHIAPVCYSTNVVESNTKRSQFNASVNIVTRDENSFGEEESSIYFCLKYKEKMAINGCMCELEIDTAADYSIMNKTTCI